jgi:hypothetical protein
MQRNNGLIDRSDLLALLVEKIETSYAEDISLLICYGSYVTGEYGGTSDIDFFFVPKTERGYELGRQFILDQIGYDLWPVSWARLSRIANLEDQPTSLLMDGEVLFASTAQDLRKLEDLKNNLRQNLQEAEVVRRVSTRYVDEAKALYFGLQDRERPMLFVDAMQIAETLLVAIAIRNGAYLRKGLKRIEQELERLLLVPSGFLENYRALIRTGNKAEVQRIVKELIVETEKACRSKFDPENVDPSDLSGFYEEFKSTYNKLLLACEEQNYENAYYAGFMIDRETQSFLIDFTGPGIFPNMIEEVLKQDFVHLRAICLEHERRLLQLLDAHGIGIHIYKDIDEFRQCFLEPTTG